MFLRFFVAWLLRMVSLSAHELQGHSRVALRCVCRSAVEFEVFSKSEDSVGDCFFDSVLGWIVRLAKVKNLEGKGGVTASVHLANGCFSMFSPDR